MCLAGVEVYFCDCETKSYACFICFRNQVSFYDESMSLFMGVLW